MDNTTGATTVGEVRFKDLDPSMGVILRQEGLVKAVKPILAHTSLTQTHQQHGTRPRRMQRLLRSWSQAANPFEKLG